MYIQEFTKGRRVRNVHRNDPAMRLTTVIQLNIIIIVEIITKTNVVLSLVNIRHRNKFIMLSTISNS